MNSWGLLGDAAQPAAFLAFRLGLTYLAHSLLWVAATALLLWAQRWSSAARHSLWKAALFGPLFSAVLACAIPESLERAPGPMPALARELALTEPSLEITQPKASGALTGLCAGAALLGALRLSGAIWQLRRRLRTRRPLQDARLRARVELLRARMGLRSVALSQTKTVASPLVIGAAEVCLPDAALAALGDAELDAVLAHELAHIERRDGLWFPVASAVASVFWLNPLNAWVCARFRESAECACDDRAVELTGNPLSLARALLHVATRATFAQRLSVVPSIAHSKSVLLQRVNRLTSSPPSAPRIASAHERLRAGVAVSVLGAFLGMLGVRGATLRSNPQAQSGPRGTPSMLTSPVAELAELSQRMVELARREQAVVARLAAIEQRPASAQEGTPEATLALELGQELRHIQATQLWLEQRAASAQR